MSDSGSPILVETAAPGVALVRIHRPEARNAMSPEVMEQLAAELEAIDQGADHRVAVIAGEGKVFAAGADLARMREQGFVESMNTAATRFWPRLRPLETPLVAAVSGYALGAGCELALACDLVVAADTAIFGQPEINVGIIPGGGASQRLVRLLGRQRAAEIVLTGRRIPAREAAEIGLVNRVVPADRCLPAAIELAAEIAAKPPLAIRLAKRALEAGLELPLSAGMGMERRLFELAMATEDRVEGMSAFLEKREPEWSGR